MDLLFKRRHIFAENDSGFGMSQEFFHQIHLKDPNPICQRAIWKSPASEAIAEEEIEKLIKDLGECFEKKLFIPILYYNNINGID